MNESVSDLGEAIVLIASAYVSSLLGVKFR